MHVDAAYEFVCSLQIKGNTEDKNLYWSWQNPASVFSEFVFFHVQEK